MSIDAAGLAAELKNKRTEMINSLQTWPKEDLEKLFNKYNTARELAEEENRLDSLLLLDEKIFQVSEALNTKNRTKEMSL